jgi:hypothetical protein
MADPYGSEAHISMSLQRVCEGFRREFDRLDVRLRLLEEAVTVLQVEARQRARLAAETRPA